MQEAVENRRGQHLIVEDVAPIAEALVAGDDETRTFVAAHQSPEEQARFLPREWQRPERVENQQARVDQLLERPLEPMLVPRPHEPRHQRLNGEQEHREAGLDRFDAQRDAEMCLAHPGRAQEHDVLGALEKAQARQFADDRAVDRRLEGDVDLVDGLDPGKRACLSRRSTPC